MVNDAPAAGQANETGGPGTVADGQGSTPPCVPALSDSLPAELVSGASSASSASYTLANRELERSLLARKLGERKKLLPN